MKTKWLKGYLMVSPWIFPTYSVFFRNSGRFPYFITLVLSVIVILFNLDLTQQLEDEKTQKQYELITYYIASVLLILGTIIAIQYIHYYNMDGGV